VTAIETVANPIPTERYGPISSGRYRIKNVVRAEAAKLLSLRSTLVMLVISVAGAGLITFLSTHGALHHSADWYGGFDPTQTSLVGMILPALVFGVFGALAVTSEYASGTIRASLAATPRRPVLLAAKFLVAATAVLVISEIMSFACFWLGQAILSGGGAPSAHLGQPGVLRAVMLTGLVVGLLSILSFGLGLILRSTAGALSAYAGVAFVLPLILRAMPGNDVQYSPTGILTNSVMATVKQGKALSATVGLELMVAYTIAVLAAGTVVFLRRDA
jgi:ABC-type transport system involved in multi-copper enzyme maturation permease subunit